MTKEQILQPISQGSPEKYSEGTAREEGALKPTTRRSFLTGAAAAVAAATVASTTGAVAASLQLGQWLDRLVEGEIKDSTTDPWLAVVFPVHGYSGVLVTR